MLWACIVLFLPTTLDAPVLQEGGRGDAPGTSTMAGTGVSIGML